MELGFPKKLGASKKQSLESSALKETAELTRMHNELL